MSGRNAGSNAFRPFAYLHIGVDVLMFETIAIDSVRIADDVIGTAIDLTSCYIMNLLCVVLISISAVELSHGIKAKKGSFGLLFLFNSIEKLKMSPNKDGLDRGAKALVVERFYFYSIS